MSDAVSSTELDGQHMELLPARTVLSMFLSGGGKGGSASNGDDPLSVTNDANNLLHTTSVGVPGPNALGGIGGQS
jgi:hypothetical protein